MTKLDDVLARASDLGKRLDSFLSRNDAAVYDYTVSVSVSDPNHPAVSRRADVIEKRVKVKAGSDTEAMTKAQSFYKRQGFKIVDTNVGPARIISGPSS